MPVEVSQMMKALPSTNGALIGVYCRLDIQRGVQILALFVQGFPLRRLKKADRSV
jgi:hypothetical protein